MASAAAAALVQLLRAVRYPAASQLPLSEAASGSPAPLLPALGWLLCRFSKHIAALVAEQGLQLTGTSDLRFVEGLLKFARDGLGLRPHLSAAQFLSQGFAERKLELACDVVRACRERHNTAARLERLAALKGLHTEQRLYSGAGAAAGGAAAAPAQQSKRQGASCKGGTGDGSRGIPKAPTLPAGVRVISGVQQAAEASGAGLAWDHPEPSTTEGSEEACSAAASPTSVAAAGGGSCSGTYRPLPAAARAMGSAKPPPSPAEQPRLLPQPLMAVQAPSGEVRAVHNQGVVPQPAQGPRAPAAERWQQQQQAWQPPHQPVPVPRLVQQQEQQQEQQEQPRLRQPTWELQQRSVEGQQDLQVPQVPLPLVAVPAEGHGHAGRQLPQLHSQVRQPGAVPYQAQQPAEMQVQAQMQQLAHALPGYEQQAQLLPAAQPQVQVQQLAVAQAQLGFGQQTRQLIEELQMRLCLAEEAALATRREAQQAQEQLQARVTVLEGRVRFLEAGFELRPASHQAQLLLEGAGGPASLLQQQQQQPYHPWQLQQQQQQQQQRPLALTWTGGLPPAPVPPVQPPPQQPPVVHAHARAAGAGTAEPHTRCNPLFAAEPSQSSVGRESGSWARQGLAPSGGGSSAATPARVAAALAGHGAVAAVAAPSTAERPALPAVPVELPPLPPLPAGGDLQGRQYSSTSELISGMQARFSEAEGFLLSLQRL